MDPRLRPSEQEGPLFLVASRPLSGVMCVNCTRPGVFGGIWLNTILGVFLGEMSIEWVN